MGQFWDVATLILSQTTLILGSYSHTIYPAQNDHQGGARRHQDLQRQWHVAARGATYLAASIPFAASHNEPRGTGWWRTFATSRRDQPRASRRPLPRRTARIWSECA